MMKVEDSIRQWKLLGLACQEFVMRVEVVLLTFQAFWCVTLCHWVSVFLTFLRIVVPSSAKVKQYKEKSYWTLEFEDEGRMILQNLENQSPNNMA